MLLDAPAARQTEKRSAIREPARTAPQGGKWIGHSRTYTLRHPTTASKQRRHHTAGSIHNPSARTLARGLRAVVIFVAVVVFVLLKI